MSFHLNKTRYCNFLLVSVSKAVNDYSDSLNGSIKIDQIREMQKSVSEKPIISNHKVCIIDDADLMTKEAQNCLLKTLEEPPEYIVIILIVSNENKINEAINNSNNKLQHIKHITLIL